MTTAKFDELGLLPDLLPAITALGYEATSPIQDQAIPVLLSGKDLVAQAQTGTGKTAAFALPILTKIDLKQARPQALVLAPTRELAIQVAEAFQKYAKHMKGFHVLPIYGGQDYRTQLRALERGVHIVVGTPGRVIDHMKRGTLVAAEMKHVVLDEADEMLRMGFIDDVEWILAQTNEARQTALFSATMPGSIQKVAKKYMRDAVEISIKSKTRTVDSIKQYYTLVAREHKVDVLTRVLEIQDVDAMIIFTQTKTMSAELADKLSARGYAAAAINGDMKQALREKVIAQLKKKHLDIVVATDVAARGIDVERVSHVVNYDIPYDSESYIHRIGRTGRAGREGTALLFVSPRERHVLRDIERATRQPIEVMPVPSAHQLNAKRVEKFTESVTYALESRKLEEYRECIEKLIQSTGRSELDIAAALAVLANKDKPLAVKENDKKFEISERESDNKQRRRSPPRGGYNKAPGHSRSRYGDKPEGGRSGKSGGRSYGKPGGRSSDRSEGNRSGGKPGGRFGDKPGGSRPGSGGKPGGRSSDKPGGKFSGKSDGRSSGRSEGKPASRKPKEGRSQDGNRPPKKRIKLG
mgnify:CR=1 FL=1|tara:strand:- start:1631 stop:3379 length:1749 start_codon:yes stop_codon:yes gene_type:complete